MLLKVQRNELTFWVKGGLSLLSMPH